MADEIAAFVSDFTAKLHPIERGRAQAWWNLATTGAEQYRLENERLENAYRELFTAGPSEFARVRAWHEGGESAVPDPMLRRQVDLLYQAFLTNQWTPEERSSVSALEADLEQEYATFRGVYRGRPLSDNEILEILKTETDPLARREAWEASKQIGARAAERVRELAHLRNAAARRLGYANHYELALAAQEIDPDELFATAAHLETLTRAPFQKVKAELDAHLGARLGVSPDQMRPWHYEDPFFQNVPAAGADSLDACFQDRDLAEIAALFYERMGLDARDIIARSDLYEREGKSQHAFSIHIDRMSDDVRVLCNLRPIARWMSTMLHECGHAVYDKYLSPDLPFLLREPAHVNTTEAIAMLMGRLAYDPHWLRAVGVVPAGGGEELLAAVSGRLRTGQLIFARWALVMMHFERDLYADPDRPDLNLRWWEHVRHFQMVTPPEGRDAPDWAAKLHLALAPVYYHNYLLGELIASQLLHVIRERVPGDLPLGSPEAGRFLREELFAQGARRPWNDTLAHATGEPLNPNYFARDFVIE